MELNPLILVLLLSIVGFICYLLGKAIMKIQMEEDHQTIRQDAIKRSRAVLTGQISEQLAPFLPDFPWKPSEARFIGKPIDFMIFQGMDEKAIDKVIFVEVKTGKSNLSPVERSLKNAIQNKNVEWQQYNVSTK